MSLVYVTTAYDGSRIMAREKDAKEACKKCDCYESCKRVDLEDGCGCLIAFSLLCQMNVKFVYVDEGGVR